MTRLWSAPTLSAFFCLAFLPGCGPIPTGSLVITQTPAERSANPSRRDILDERYPPGSRIVLVSPPFNQSSVRVLSKGLFAAGGAVVCPDGKRALFVGKTERSGTWQVYEADLARGHPRQLTRIPGGAMDPDVIAGGAIVLSAPVPRIGEMWKSNGVPALYVRPVEGEPRRITFGARGAIEPTVLSDGRILFLSPWAATNTCEATPSLGLFTVNNDGTEVTPFALDHDGAATVHRPRELAGGSIGFVASGDKGGASWVETVRTARPFASRAGLPGLEGFQCRAVEPGPDERLLVCAAPREETGTRTTAGVYQLSTASANSGMPLRMQVLYDDIGWNEIEVAAAGARRTPIGHISAMVPGKKTGTVLCLDASFTRPSVTNSMGGAKPWRVRITSLGSPEVWGEVPLQADGSFMAELPADTPFGLETLDSDGRVLKKLPPSIWVRPGETRTCIGCHELYNRSPRNRRPLAVNQPPARLGSRQQTPEAN